MLTSGSWNIFIYFASVGIINTTSIQILTIYDQSSFLHLYITLYVINIVIITNYHANIYDYSLLQYSREVRGGIYWNVWKISAYFPKNLKEMAIIA